MTLQALLTGWSVPQKEPEKHIRKYSTTADILSYRRCRRQYGYFGVRGFSSATATQRYFGTLVHDVLDRINRNYRLSPAAGLPDAAAVRMLVQEAHDRLIRSGVRPYNSSAQQEQATKLIHRFVALMGPHFFPHVQETEYRLERALKTHAGRDYVLDGVVDILSGAVSHALGLPFPTQPSDIEIWDYKSGKMPAKDSQELRDYEYQMRVYAELYRQQTGRFPARTILVFVGELGDDHRWDIAQMDPSMFPRLVYPLHPIVHEIETAIDTFHATVEEIEAEREKSYAQQWGAPAQRPGDETCEACDLRFNCAAYPEGARLRREPL